MLVIYGSLPSLGSMSLSIFCPETLRVSVLPLQANALHGCATIQHHTQIWHCTTEEEKQLPPCLSFQEYKSVSQKLPRRMPIMSFWLEQDHISSSKPITGNRTGTTMDNFNHSETDSGEIDTWMTLEDSASKIKGRDDSWIGHQQCWPQRPGLILSKANSCHFCKEPL